MFFWSFLKFPFLIVFSETLNSWKKRPLLESKVLFGYNDFENISEIWKSWGEYKNRHYIFWYIFKVRWQITHLSALIFLIQPSNIQIKSKPPLLIGTFCYFLVFLMCICKLEKSTPFVNFIILFLSQQINLFQQDID